MLTIGNTQILKSSHTRTGPGITDHVNFEVLTDKPIEDVGTVQAYLGYHPCGYGGPNGVRIQPQSDGNILYHWYCWGSCD
jgi:hypothetical protein